MKVRIALVGDFTPEAKADRAIPIALALAGAGNAVPCEFHWIHTSMLLDDPGEQLGTFQGIWCVPTRGLGAIRFAREAGRPFLGTCGGFQHALLECAESLWNIEAPAQIAQFPAGYLRSSPRTAMAS